MDPSHNINLNTNRLTNSVDPQGTGFEALKEVLMALAIPFGVYKIAESLAGRVTFLASASRFLGGFSNFSLSSAFLYLYNLSKFFKFPKIFNKSFGFYHTTPLKDTLSGATPFYTKDNYESTTRDELSSSKGVLFANYTYNIESMTSRVLKVGLFILIFPIGIYKLTQLAIGQCFVPSSSPELSGTPKDEADEWRQKTNLQEEWKFKRIRIDADDYQIDALMVGQESTLANGKWVLFSNGSGELYEHSLRAEDQYKKNLLSDLNANGLFFNYPGVGASKGALCREGMIKAYRAMLALLEDQKKGIAAKQIIGYSYSLGGAVEAEALSQHELNEDLQYVFVKDRTFSDLSSAASELFPALLNKVVSCCIKIFGWNMTTKAVCDLKAPQIIIQTAQVKEPQEITDESQILNDGMISKKASLASKILQRAPGSANPFVLGIPEEHNFPIQNRTLLVEKINECFPPANQ